MPSTFNDIVDGVSTSLAIKAPVQVASTTHLALSGLVVVGSTQTTEGMRVLVNAQNDPLDNGIYKASSGAWQRAADFNGARDAAEGALVFVNSSDTYYRLTSTNPVVIGTSDITWVEMAIAAATAAYYANYAALAAVYGVVGNQQVLVGGGTEIGDGGAGTFYWGADSSATAVTGIVINPVGNVGAGRWIRIYNGPVNPKWFGAAEDGTTDDTDVFETIIDAGFKELVLNAGAQYKITRTLMLPDTFCLRGSATLAPYTSPLATPVATILWRPAGADTVCIKNVPNEYGQTIEDLLIDIDDDDHSGIAFLNSNANCVRRVQFIGTWDIGLYANQTYVCRFEDLAFNGSTAKRACVYVYATNATVIRNIHTSTYPSEVGTRSIGIALYFGDANTIENPVLQGNTAGIMLGIPGNTVINNPYFENTLIPMITGDPSGSAKCVGTSVYGGIYKPSNSGHPQYASRGPIWYMPNTDRLSIYSPNMIANSVGDSDVIGFFSPPTARIIAVHSPRFFQSDFRTEFTQDGAATTLAPYATGIDYGSTRAQETILKADGVFAGTSYGLRVDSAGTLTQVVFTPPTWGGTPSALHTAAFPQITSL